MEHDADLLITGGGLNGPLLALLLARAGLNVAIIDAARPGGRSAEGFDGRSYALALASVRMLKAMGLWDRLAPHAEAMRAIRTEQGRAAALPGMPVGFGPGMGFSGDELEEGPLGQMVEDRHLSAALLAALQAEPGITLHAGTKVVAQQIGPEGVRLGLDTGGTLSGRLLIGADGRMSGVASRAGIRRQVKSYRQTALVCALECTAPHEGTAWQIFLPGGPLALLPLQGNRVSVVWSEPEASAEGIRSLDDAGFLVALAARLGGRLGEIRLAGARFAYPLSLSLAEAWVRPRLALIGDAAHGVHPIAGQGLNLGLRDVAALAEVLIEAIRRGEDFAALDVLERYEAWRRPDTMALALGMDAVNTLFSNENPVIAGLRGLGMAAVSALPGLRRGFIRQAAGLVAGNPRLLDGRPI